MGRGFTSGGQESGSVLAQLVQNMVNKCFVESLPLVLKEAASLKVKGSLYLLIARLPSSSRTFN